MNPKFTRISNGSKRRDSKRNFIFLASIILGLTLFSLLVIQSMGEIMNTSVIAKSGITPDGFQLRLGLSTTVLPYGGSVNVSVFEYNTLSKVNNVSAASDWALSAFADWGCPQSSSAPIAFALYEGRYTTTNISGATALPLTPPGFGGGCPERDYASFTFNPESATMTATLRMGSATASQVSSAMSMSTSMIIHGFYSTTLTQRIGPNGSSFPALIHFTSGEYTVAGGDEWGDLVLSYLEVA